MNKFNKDFRLDTIFDNIVLYLTEGFYRLTNDPKVKYEVPMSDNSSDDDKLRAEKEIFQQLLVTAEQFLRYSTAVGIMPILEGVQNVQRELLERGVRRATSIKPSQVRTKKQLSEMKDVSDVIIESYFRLLKTKFPVLSWIDVLIDDLVNSSDKFQVLAGRSREIDEDWIVVYDKVGRTYRAAKGQFNRVMTLLRTNIEAIEATVLLGHGDSEVRLLTDIRRINEFMFEGQSEQEVRVGEIELKDDERDRLITGLATVGILIAAALGLIPVYLYIVDRLFDFLGPLDPKKAVGSAAIILAIMVSILSYFFVRPDKLYKRLYSFAHRMFGRQNGRDKHEARGEEQVRPQERLMVSLKVNRPIKREEFLEQIEKFWAGSGNSISEIQASLGSGIPRWQSDRSVDRPNEDMRRYKYSLKKTDSGSWPVASRFAIYLEVGEYPKANSCILRSVEVLVYGPGDVRPHARRLVEILFSRNFFVKTGDQDHASVKSELLESIG